jgi:hypothetical protein
MAMTDQEQLGVKVSVTMGDTTIPLVFEVNRADLEQLIRFAAKTGVRSVGVGDFLGKDHD